MSVCRRFVLWSLLVPWGGVTAAEPSAANHGVWQAADWKIDFRYQPPGWQTLIGLPDDWQKTLVGKEGQLLYDFPGKHSGFKTRIALGVEGASQWVRQELVSPRIPIVQTVLKCGSIEITSEAFAVAPPLDPDANPALPVQRLDGDGELKGWAAPTVPCDPAFRDIAVGMGRSIRYAFRAEADRKYTVVFGLCEGWWKEPGKRRLDLQIEGRTCKTLDLVREHGTNVPAIFAFPARDENQDGWIEIAVAAGKDASDKNTILNLLWLFKGDAPPADQLLSGEANAKALVCVKCGAGPAAATPRHDVVLAQFQNMGQSLTSVTPTLTVDSEYPIKMDKEKLTVVIGGATTLYLWRKSEVAEEKAGKLVLRFPPLKIEPGSEESWTVGVARGPSDQVVPRCVPEAQSLREKAKKHWESADLPYDRIQVPDPGIQALIDGSIRNIYQAREIKKGLPAFQVGPTCYRGLWVVDGSFLLEAVTFLGRAAEARNGIRYLLSFQRDDGAIMLMDGHWKETGITLWAVTRHARLTNDPAWLREVWPQCERGFQYIRKLRELSRQEPNSPAAGLIPAGMSDGGLGGKYPEYTNVYWTLIGMKAAVEAAQWLDKTEQAADWGREYEDFLATFRRAAERDMKTDAHGNRHLPIRMVDDQHVAPQKGQWGFLHAVFPGQLFASDDPLVRGNLALLRANECEGLVFGTGWLSDGIWNYFGSFYGHGWLWTGDGQKAAQALYAFGNHASPLLCWREEHRPQGQPDMICGDMPHNWASAEFIRLVRDLLVLERGRELHLFEGLPPAWIVPGEAVRLREVLTEFGPLSCELRTHEDGTKVTLHMEPLRRNPPKKVLVHLDGWSGRTGTLELPGDQAVERDIPLTAVPKG